MKNQLIQIYLLVCQIYDSHSSLKFGRASNFKPRFTDQEIITVYLFGQLNEKFNHRQIHQAFNRRLNLLTDNFQTLFAY